MLIAAALIAILLAMAMPVLGQWQRRTGANRCLANLRQIGAGLALYMQDHGVFPTFGNTSDMTRWYDGSADPDSFFAGPYLHSAPKMKRHPADATPSTRGSLFDCPSIDRHDPRRRGPETFLSHDFDYGINLTLCGRRLIQIPRPARTVAVADGGHYARIKARWRDGITYLPHNTANPGATQWDWDPSPLIPAHGGRIHLLFMDGHAAPHEASELSEAWFNALP